MIRKNCTLLLAFFGLLFNAVVVSAAALPDTTPTAGDAFEQLKQLLEQAPARQIGQPGNDVIDQLIKQRFGEVVARQNDPQRWEQAQQLVVEADKATAAMGETLDAIHRAHRTDSGFIDSPWYVLYSLEKPWMVCFILVSIAGVLLLTWKYQKRKELLATSIFFASLAVVLLLASIMIETDAEAAVRNPSSTGPRTTEGLKLARDQAAREALNADLQAAQALAGLWQNGRIVFPTSAFIPGHTTISINDQKLEIYPLAPNGGNPGNLPPVGFAGRLVYVGRGTPAELADKKLEGAVVLIDFHSEDRWIDTVTLGASAVIVLEPPADKPANTHDAITKQSLSPVSVPRFYMTRQTFARLGFSDLSQALSSPMTVSIQQEPGRWERREVATDWLFIPSADQMNPSKAADEKASSSKGWGKQLVHLQAYKDGSSIVPQLSPGAQSGANIILLLRLVDHFEQHPPQRPVLMTVVNDHINSLNGEEETAFVCFGTVKPIRREITWLNRKLALERFIAEVYSQQPNHQLTEPMRGQIQRVGGQIFEVKKPIVEELMARRNRLVQQIQRHTALIDLAEKKRKRNAKLSQAELQQITHDIEQLEEKNQQLQPQADVYLRLSKVFNRLGKRLSYDELSVEDQEQLAQLFKDVASSANVAVRQLQRNRKLLQQNLSIRRRLLGATTDLTRPVKDDAAFDKVFARQYAPLPALAVLTLDLSFGSDRLGLFHGGYMARNMDESATRTEWLREYAFELANSKEDAAYDAGILVDIKSQWKEQMGGDHAAPAQVMNQYAVAALTLTSVRDERALAYTPHDTIDRIDRQRFNHLMDFAEAFIPALINSKGLYATRRPTGVPITMSTQIIVRKIDDLTFGLPNVTLAHAVLMAPTGGPLPPLRCGQVRLYPILITDDRGTVVARGQRWDGKGLAAFGFDPTFSHITEALDFGESERNYSSVLEPSSLGYQTLNILAYEFDKIDLFGLTLPLRLSPVTEVQLLDAQQNSLPRRFSSAGVNISGSEKIMPVARDGTGSIFVDPDMPFKLLIEGIPAINGDEDHPKGRGFATDIGRLENLALLSAKDTFRLNADRLKLLVEKGVRNETAQAMNEQAHEHLEDAEQFIASDQLDQAQISTEIGRGLVYRAYGMVRGTISDLVKAVVIFLGLVLPFCFFVMKLITPFTDINKQLAIFGGLFVAMAVLLHLVHPAFGVTSTPQVVVLAFVILGLSVFVASVLLGKFNATMSQAIEASQMSESVDAPQSRLLGAAFVVGVNNMKRRRIRTALTAVTIILVTFTTLSVMSVGQRIEPIQLRLADTAPYDGFVFTRPGLGPIDALQMRRLRAHFSGRATTISRYWAQQFGEHKTYLSYELRLTEPIAGARAEYLTAKVLLGLEVGEHGFISPLPIVAGDWFSSNDAAEVVLSKMAAGFLGIDEHNFAGQTLWLRGHRLKLVGLMDDEKLSVMRDIGDIPLLPLLSRPSADQLSVQDNEQQQKAEASGTVSFGGGGDMQSDPGIYQASPKDVVLVPIDFARSLDEGDYRVLAVKYHDRSESLESAAVQAWLNARDLTQYQHLRLSVGLTKPVTHKKHDTQVAPGQYALASSSSTDIGGILKVAIPIALGATIILNTMLGAVMERRREIGIYNAIGLNPTHVMMFFLAEALVFGLVGSVAGYLIGQIFSVLITRFDLMELNLNYSSLSVILVIFITITTVLLSTLYPAMMAARAAVPSGQRRWSMPRPQGDQIHIVFPFIYDPSRVKGICAYLNDFMKQNTEASTGKFLTTPSALGIVAGDEAKPNPTYAMLYDVAPAPFDLGVNQHMEVYAYFNTRLQTYMLDVYLTRISGERSNWVTVNQPFLESLRKRLLGWRSQRDENQQAFIEQGHALFDGTPLLPAVSIG